MLRQVQKSTRQNKRFRGGADADDSGVEEEKQPEKKKKYVPPPFRTFVLVRREGDVWIPLRQYSAQSPRNVALKAKVPSGSIVSVQDPVSARVHEYKTLIEKIPESERTRVQRDRNITTRKKVYKNGMFSCPPCGEGFRRDVKTTSRRKEVVEASAQTDDSSDEEEDGGTSSDDSEASSMSDDDDTTQVAIENFLQKRRQKQRTQRELQDMIDEDEESNFFEMDNQTGQKQKR